jgi:hypothetical protein
VAGALLDDGVVAVQDLDVEVGEGLGQQRLGVEASVVMVSVVMVSVAPWRDNGLCRTAIS